MFRILFILFVIIPIIEIAVLMQVGSLLGVWPTIAIVIVTAWLGAKNVRAQGIVTLQSVQTKMAQGEAPSDEIVAGLLLLVAGVLMVTPGFVTDFFGLSLLIPQVRANLIRSVQHHIVAQGNRSNTHFKYQQFQQHENSPFDQEDNSRHQGNTIDGEFERKD